MKLPANPTFARMDSPYRENFPPAFYARFPVERLTPEQTDELLENGWFRHNTLVSTFAIKNMDNTLRSTVMLRLPLQNFTWKQRLRKLMRRNEQAFSVKIQPCQFTEEKDLLWQKFKQEVHRWSGVFTLDKHLMAGFPAENFNTWEVSVRYEGRLVAFSVFDLGRRSLGSLEAAYDPAFSKYSLGLWTMLLEIDFAQRQGLEFFYPGFLPKDLPMFNYKLRPGGLQFYRFLEKRWLPLEQLAPRDWMLERVGERLAVLQQAIQTAGGAARLIFSPHYFKPTGGFDVALEAYNFMLLILNPENPAGGWHFLAAWDVQAERYFLFFANVGQGLASLAKISTAPVLHLFGVAERQFLGKFLNEIEMLERLKTGNLLNPLLH
ncbi:MAG: GNAT family N-acetyltransferase [Bacteroidota bacterium]